MAGIGLNSMGAADIVWHLQAKLRPNPAGSSCLEASEMPNWTVFVICDFFSYQNRHGCPGGKNYPGSAGVLFRVVVRGFAGDDDVVDV